MVACKTASAEQAATKKTAVRATGTNARLLEEVEKAALGEPSAALDGRSIQAYLTHKLARGVNAGPGARDAVR